VGDGAPAKINTAGNRAVIADRTSTGDVHALGTAAIDQITPRAGFAVDDCAVPGDVHSAGDHTVILHAAGGTADAIGAGIDPHAIGDAGNRFTVGVGHELAAAH